MKLNPEPIKRYHTYRVRFRQKQVQTLLSPKSHKIFLVNKDINKAISINGLKLNRKSFTEWVKDTGSLLCIYYTLAKPVATLHIFFQRGYPKYIE